MVVVVQVDLNDEDKIVERVARADWASLNFQPGKQPSRERERERPVDKVSASRRGFQASGNFWPYPRPFVGGRRLDFFVRPPALTAGCKHTSCSNCNKRPLVRGKLVGPTVNSSDRAENRLACAQNVPSSEYYKKKI